MKAKYMCNECGALFDEPKKRRENHTEIAQDGTIPFEEFYVCPVCGSDWFSDAEYCQICGEPLRDGIDICNACKIELVDAIQNCVEERLGEDEDYKEALDAAWDYLADVIRNR